MTEEVKQEGACACGECEPQKITLVELSHMVEDGVKEMSYYRQGYYVGLALLLFVVYEALGGLGALGAAAAAGVYYCHVNSNALAPRLARLKNTLQEGVAASFGKAQGTEPPDTKEEDGREVGGNFL